jgi:hypothetical protein
MGQTDKELVGHIDAVRVFGEAAEAVVGDNLVNLLSADNLLQQPVVLDGSANNMREGSQHGSCLAVTRRIVQVQTG